MPAAAGALLAVNLLILSLGTRLYWIFLEFLVYSWFVWVPALLFLWSAIMGAVMAAADAGLRRQTDRRNPQHSL